jgi:hypothetical protein
MFDSFYRRSRWLIEVNLVSDGRKRNGRERFTHARASNALAATRKKFRGVALAAQYLAGLVTQRASHGVQCFLCVGAVVFIKIQATSGVNQYQVSPLQG